MDRGGILRGANLGGRVFSRRKGEDARQSLGVRDDWIRALPREKNEIFEATARRWECWYAMLSIALDDGISLRARGKLVCARQQVGVSADLLRRLSAALIDFCEIAARRARRITSAPAVEPMRTEFFRSEAGQSAASWNNVLHRVLFVGRSRFVHKVRILANVIEQIERRFTAAAEEVARGTSAHPGECWKKLDCLHYDFNTCLREAEIVLKSFLRALPVEQVQLFAAEIDSGVAPGPSKGLAEAISRPASA